MDKQKSLEKLNAFGQGTMMEHIGIEITDFEKDYICGKMPVDNRTGSTVWITTRRCVSSFRGNFREYCRWYADRSK